MMAEAGLRRILHQIAKCPHCAQQHTFPVVVRARVAAVPLFGGGRGAVTLAFTCPITNRIINEPIPDLPDSEVVGPDDSNGPAAVSAHDANAPRSPVEQEFADWTKASRTTAVDFCKTMLTASTGAIPVYFAILKYLGTETAWGSWFSTFAALPPLLFLASAIVFALALRPRYTVVKPEGFEEFRRARLEHLNRGMLTGLVLFSGGVLIAIALGLSALVVTPRPPRG